MPEFLHVNSKKTLNDFNRKSKNRVIFVKYYMDGCGHCQDLEPIWEMIEYSIKLNYPVSDVLITQLNAEYMYEANIPNVEGFPTISIINNNNKVDFTGNRTKEGILQFFIDNGLDKIKKTLRLGRHKQSRRKQSRRKRSRHRRKGRSSRRKRGSTKGRRNKYNRKTRKS